MKSLYMKGSAHWAEYGAPKQQTLWLTSAQREVVEAAVSHLRDQHGPRPDGKAIPRSVCLDYMALETSDLGTLCDGVANQEGESKVKWWYRQYPDQEELIATIVAMYQLSHPDAPQEEAITAMAATYLATKLSKASSVHIP